MRSKGWDAGKGAAQGDGARCGGGALGGRRPRSPPCQDARLWRVGGTAGRTDAKTHVISGFTNLQIYGLMAPRVTLYDVHIGSNPLRRESAQNDLQKAKADIKLKFK